MAESYQAAVDGILSTLKTAWDAGAAALNGAVLPVLVYEYLEKDLKPHPRDTGVAWARATVRHYASKATAIGNKKYRRVGMVWVQVFVPNAGGLAPAKAQALAALAGKAYESARGNLVSYKDVSVAEKDPDGPWTRADCTASFWWDEIR